MSNIVTFSIYPFKSILSKRIPRNYLRMLATNSERDVTNSSDKIHRILRQRFEVPDEIRVDDISGGCGASFRVFVGSSQFKAKTRVEQHRLVMNALGTEIKSLHAISIETKVV